MTNTLSRARAVIIRDNHLLMMHRVKNGLEYYTLCGGKAEPGETPEQTCRREIKEETGLDVRIRREIAQHQDVHEGILNTHYIFECDDLGGEPQLGGEEAEKSNPANSYQLTWVKMSRLPELTIMPPWMAAILLDHI